MKTLSLQKGKSNYMDLHASKLDVMQKIMSVLRTSLLEKINTLLDKEMVVGYTAQGEPLTKESYNMQQGI